MANVQIARLRVVGIYLDLQNFLVLEPGQGQPVTIKDVLDAVKGETIERISSTRGSYTRFDYGNNPDRTGLTFFEVENPVPANDRKPVPDQGVYRIEDNVEIPAPDGSQSRPSRLVWQWYLFGRNPVEGRLGLPESQDGVFNGINSVAAVVRDHESIIIRPVAIVLPRNVPSPDPDPTPDT